MGKKGNWKNYGSTAGKWSKKSGSDDVSSRKTSGKTMNIEELDRTKMRNIGSSKGNEEVVTERPKKSESTDASTIKTSGASSKGGMHSAQKGKE